MYKHRNPSLIPLKFFFSSKDCLFLQQYLSIIDLIKMTKLFLILLTLITTVLSSLNLNAQLEFPEDKVSWKFSVEQSGEEATIIATITMVEHWHIYAVHIPEGSFTLPTELNLKPSSDFKLIGKITEPKPIFVHDDLADEDLYFHSNTIVLKQKIRILTPKDFTVKGVFAFQTCDDTHCLPPHEVEFEVKVKGARRSAVEAPPDEITETNNENEETNNESIAPEDENNSDSTVAATSQDENTETHSSENESTTVTESEINDESEDSESKSMWTIFIIAFASGLAALLTPCVFPMIPMTVSFFTKQSKSKAEGIKNAIIFGISIIVIFTLLGTVVTAIFGSDSLNAMSTNVWFNLIFFVLLVVFAVSFMGAFEIRLPTSWLNKADSKADKGGLIGIFFMALALALVSFSCTGPIIGSLLVESATMGGYAPAIGMFGFSLALALPFTLFAAFPGWLNSLPKSGGWLNTVKVVLGFLELALAFKFLSNADLVVQGHMLERELFLAIWIGIFGVLALYLFGKISLPHDDKVERLSVGRALFGTTVVIFVIYLIPGLWGAPRKIISGFPPPMSYSESPMGLGGSGGGHSSSSSEIVEGMHAGEHGIMLFHDYDLGIAYAQKVGKPVLLDFTGYACVNCRRMESNVWGAPVVLDILKNKVVMISLYVDDKTKLPKEEQITVQVTDKITRNLKSYGNKWSHLQATRYQTNSQPYYRMLGPDLEDLENGSADYQDHGTPEAFEKWLSKGLELYKK